MVVNTFLQRRLTQSKYVWYGVCEMLTGKVVMTATYKIQIESSDHCQIQFSSGKIHCIHMSSFRKSPNVFGLYAAKVWFPGVSCKLANNLVTRRNP